MEKLISGASTGSSGKRAGIGPTESASRPRRGEPIERENKRSVHRGDEDSLTRWHSLAETPGGETTPSSTEQPTSTRVPETLPPPPPPARASPPRTSPRVPSPPPPTPPGRFRLESVGESQPSSRQMRLAAPPTPSPRPAPARPALLLLPLVQCCTSQLGQRKATPDFICPIAI
ncbi:uncharacterized protein RBU33_012782 isoform 2-T3 [Hipposideros larvatus]